MSDPDPIEAQRLERVTRYVNSDGESLALFCKKLIDECAVLRRLCAEVLHDVDERFMGGYADLCNRLWAAANGEEVRE